MDKQGGQYKKLTGELLGLQCPMSTPSIYRLKKLRNLEKSREGDAVDSSSISRLPDEIILQILSKLSDLKTLCLCYLVSKRFSSIVLEVDTISFAVTRLNPLIVDKNSIPPILSSFYGDSFLPATKFLRKFRGVKSFRIKLTSSSHAAIDNRCLFKWKVKFAHRIESFIFLSPNSVCDDNGFYLNGSGDEEENSQSIEDMFMQKFNISFQCMMDLMEWHMMLLWFIYRLPMLEKVSITDSGQTGRLSLRGKKLNEVKEWVHSASEALFTRVEIPQIRSHCNIPVLKLPVSGYVMKGIYCSVMEMKDVLGGSDYLKKSENSFEDKEDAAYNEAMMEILEKHKGMMHTYDPLGALL